MNFALVYIVQRLLYRIGDFFHHWYVRATRTMAHAFISFCERLDETFALMITLRHFFEPLYKDYSIVGRLLGIIFRTGRVLVGIVVYAIIAAVFLIFLIVWFLIPPALVLYIILHS